MSDTEELTLWENIKNSRVFIQYFMLMIVMSAVNIILNQSYGNVTETFFCKDISQSFVNSKKLLWLFTLLVYVAIIAVREWTRKVDFAGLTNEEKREEFKDFMLYVVICLATFIFAGAYIRRKFSSGTQGGGGDGVFKDTVGKISSTSFGTLALYTGIVIILINVISNSYQFLKNKQHNLKDKFLRAIYFAQIATMLIFVISTFFIAGFGCTSLQKSSGFNIFIALVKWGIVIAGSILGVHMINLSTDGENWFGDAKHKNASNINFEADIPQQDNEDDEYIDGEVEVGN